MNGVDGVRAVNKYIPFACGGGVYTYIFVYHVFTIFSDPFNESFYEVTIPQVFEFWVSNRLFFKVRIHVPGDYRCIHCRLNTTGVKSLKHNVHIVLYHLSPNQDITTIIFYINKLGHLFWSINKLHIVHCTELNSSLIRITMRSNLVEIVWIREKCCWPSIGVL